MIFLKTLTAVMIVMLLTSCGITTRDGKVIYLSDCVYFHGVDDVPQKITGCDVLTPETARQILENNKRLSR